MDILIKLTWKTKFRNTKMRFCWSFLGFIELKAVLYCNIETKDDVLIISRIFVTQLQLFANDKVLEGLSFLLQFLINPFC